MNQQQASRFLEEATASQVSDFFAQANYEVVDCQTKRVVGTFKNKQAARNKRDRLDAAYGAVRYVVRVA